MISAAASTYDTGSFESEQPYFVAEKLQTMLQESQYNTIGYLYMHIVHNVKLHRY